MFMAYIRMKRSKAMVRNDKQDTNIKFQTAWKHCMDGGIVVVAILSLWKWQKKWEWKPTEWQKILWKKEDVPEIHVETGW